MLGEIASSCLSIRRGGLDPLLSSSSPPWRIELSELKDTTPSDPLDFARLSIEIWIEPIESAVADRVERIERHYAVPLQELLNFKTYFVSFTKQKCLNLSHEIFSILYYCFLVHRYIYSYWFTFLSRKFVPFNESAVISSSPVYLNGAIAFHFI